MALTVTANRKNKTAQVHLNATGTIVVAGNNSVSTIATDDEVLTGATIRQVFAGCASGGSVVIARGGETVGVYDSTGWYDYAGAGMPLSVNRTANLDITITGTAYILLELTKEGTGSSEYLVG